MVVHTPSKTHRIKNTHTLWEWYEGKWVRICNMTIPEFKEDFEGRITSFESIKEDYMAVVDSTIKYQLVKLKSK